jgi:wyosine [tRNA(Phe)-imidazoG37] synthetase (radical SAM superfamily)
MSDKCKELQKEVLKEVRDINPDPNLLKETRSLMEQFNKVNINKNVAIHPRAEKVYWDMRNKEKAEWFAKRFNDNGKVVSRPVRKSDIFAYTNSRGEEEIIFIGRTKNNFY